MEVRIDEDAAFTLSLSAGPATLRRHDTPSPREVRSNGDVRPNA
jgi:hypothetical protein